MYFPVHTSLKVKNRITIIMSIWYFCLYLHLLCGNFIPLIFSPYNFSKGYLECMICEPVYFWLPCGIGYFFFLNSWADDTFALRPHFPANAKSSSLAPNVSESSTAVDDHEDDKDDPGPVNAQRWRPWYLYQGDIFITNYWHHCGWCFGFVRSHGDFRK